MASTVNVVRVLNISSRITRSFLSNHTRWCLMSSTATHKSENDATKTESVDTPQEKDSVVQERDKLTSQVQKLEEDLKESKDKYLRALAETENLRKRMIKQVDEAKIFGIQSFCKDLLDVSDILSTAINSVPKENLNNSNPHLVNLFQGLNMTDSQLVKVFNKHGLESISPTLGDKFDPNYHEALFQVPIQSEKTQVPDTVAIVQKIGYKLHSRTLRPALVGVFKAS
uniref:GrpE protein homolog n=1 Tax=Arion vulgaris TaxID=1028688 RepID=A0A0B6ZL25_9EUPU